MKQVTIIGGGLAGLTNAILLIRAGISVQLFEEKQYPFHRVCGEYISNEVLPFLEKHKLYPEVLRPSQITQFHLSAVSGNYLEMPLDLGGFGVSRYSLDHWLATIALQEGVEVIHERVSAVQFVDGNFQLTTTKGNEYNSSLVVGAFGKRSSLDKNLNRKFIQRRSPYIGVKYHIQTDQMNDHTIALHNFEGGYCGVSRIENGTFNLCYLSHRSNLKKNGSIPSMEEAVLMKNPQLRHLLNNSESLFPRPEVINEITFESKDPVFNHILMTGDSAGMITPLCGNGMAMAIHSAKILSELIAMYFKKEIDRDKLERYYIRLWNKLFSTRLWAGRNIQKLFGSPFISEWAVGLGKTSRSISSFLMKQTHGQPFS